MHSSTATASLLILSLGALGIARPAPATTAAPLATATAMPAQGSSDRLPDPIGPLRIPENANEELNMLDLLKEFGRLTGQQIILSEQTRQTLSQVPVGVVEGGFDVPTGEVYSFVEGLLLHAQCVMAQVNGGEFPLLAVYGSQNEMRRNWMEVDAGEIGRYAGHPALLVQTVVDVSPMDARQASNSMRGMLRDHSYQFITSAGAESGLIVRGTGRQVSDMISMLGKASEFEAKRLEAERREQEKRQREAEPEEGK